MINYTILAVDDQPEYLQTYAAYFFEEKVPYKIISALNGKMALELAAIEHPDVIIMDWQMPVMDGLCAVKEIKKDKNLKDIPIIMSSGIMLNSEDLKEALEAGASDYIRKPVDKTELLARVHSHIKMARYIKTLKDQKETIETERTQRVIHIKETLHELCDKTEEMIRFTFKEHKNIISDLENLKIKNQGEKEILDHITKVLADICNVYNNYHSVCQLHLNEEDYIKKLIKKHPQLLPGEIELCLLLKKNLPSKDIAALTYRSVNTIKVSRSKLRTKLGINADDNLFNYLLMI
jgi:DNA-binding response OmpR family regulator/DNA-binding CsgD family transcriptional regulator